DEAELKAFPGRDVAGGEDHAHRTLHPDLPGQALQAARESGEADARLGQGEGRVFGGDNEIARERDLEATAHRNAVDGCDDRLVAVEARGEAGETALV